MSNNSLGSIDVNAHERRIAAALARNARRRRYAIVDTGSALTVEEVLGGDESGIAVARELLYFLNADGQHPGALLRRVYILLKAITPEAIGDLTLTEIGMIFGETRAAVSIRVKRVFSSFQKKQGAKGFKAPFQRSETACVAMSRAQMGNRNRWKSVRP